MEEFEKWKKASDAQLDELEKSLDELEALSETLVQPSKGKR